MGIFHIALLLLVDQSHIVFLYIVEKVREGFVNLVWLDHHKSAIFVLDDSICVAARVSVAVVDTGPNNLPKWCDCNIYTLTGHHLSLIHI